MSSAKKSTPAIDTDVSAATPKLTPLVPDYYCAICGVGGPAYLDWVQPVKGFSEKDKKKILLEKDLFHMTAEVYAHELCVERLTEEQNKRFLDATYTMQPAKRSAEEAS